MRNPGLTLVLMASVGFAIFSMANPNTQASNRGASDRKSEIMPNDVAHFAIHADDCERAKKFYETVFGWTFQAWGPPDFWRIETNPGAIHGALQKRLEPLTKGGMAGYECTISVTDVNATAKAIEAAGGQVSMKPYRIEGVGTLIMFLDTEGNRAGAMRYNPGVL